MLENTCALLTKQEVKMAGYWPSFFFFCIFMDRDEVKIYKNAKLEQGQYLAILTEQACMVNKGFIAWSYMAKRLH